MYISYTKVIRAPSQSQANLIHYAFPICIQDSLWMRPISKFLGLQKSSYSHYKIMAANMSLLISNDPSRSVEAFIHCYWLTGELFITVLAAQEYQGRTVVSPYVGMARKQDGGSNGCISNYTAITQLGTGFTRF